MSTRKLGHFNREMSDFVDADYLDDLTDEEFAWVQQFYKEYYDNKFTSTPIHSKKLAADIPAKREWKARMDVFNLSTRRGQLEYMSERPTALEEDTSTPPYDYEEIYKRDGYKAALESITTSALNQLDEGIVDTEVVLQRYYIQRDKLRRLEARDRVAERDLIKRKKKGKHGR